LGPPRYAQCPAYRPIGPSPEQDVKGRRVGRAQGTCGTVPPSATIASMR
jgi:hypothetical protein